ncbi:MAG TPA: LLM class F420-dependent oxidoreductase [Acidimicrobiia bacterium]|nr:LLM class F420-dependent oxidoreductase [Acidimicrobiia bacterium]
MNSIQVDDRYGVTVPLSGMPLARQRDLIAEIADLGYTDLWSAEADGTDAFTPLVLASQWAPELRLGTAIVPAFTRGPLTLAQSAATLANLSGGRFVLGLGTSSDVIVERWNGVPFDRPYHRVRDMVRCVKALSAGEKVTADFDTFSVKGAKLAEPAARPMPVMVAALRPGMLRLAGRESDGAIINWLAASDVPTVAPYVRESDPGKEIVARIFVCPIADADRARAVGRRMVTAYLNVPVYAAFHEWLGRGDVLRKMWDAWRGGDRQAALDAVPDSVVDELLIHGRPEECREKVEAYREAGVTTPVLMLIDTEDPAAALRGLALH